MENDQMLFTIHLCLLNKLSLDSVPIFSFQFKNKRKKWVHRFHWIEINLQLDSHFKQPLLVVSLLS